MNALEIVNLEKSYPGTGQVLRGVTLPVPEGSIMALLGLNGSGKTTTLRVVMGLAPFQHGSIALFGAGIDPRAAAHRNLLGAVLDEPLYFDWLSPRDFLVLNGRLRGLDRRTAAERTEEILVFFDLHSRRHEPIRTLSTGMKKKVSLAAAVLHRPRLLVLDEPFEGIDPLAARDIRETLQVMSSRGTTVLVTSHILDTVERLCTDIAVLHDGRIALQCGAEELRPRAASLERTGGGDLEAVFLELVSTSARKIPPEFLS